MIMPKSSDLLQAGYSPRYRIRWRHADVTDSARALAQAHLCGPSAALVLAEALGGVALLAGELTQRGETVALRMRVDGPVQGVLVEADREGALRGYPQIKILNDFDGGETIQSEPVLGGEGQVGIIRSLPGTIISQAAFACSPPSVRQALDRYYAVSLQRMAFCLIQAFAYEGGVDLARGFLVDCLPDGDPAEFQRLRAAAADGLLAEALEHADGARGVGEELGLTDAVWEPPRPLRFACRCSRERAWSVLAALSPAERREMAAAGTPADINCHMCGRHYTFGRDALAEVHGDDGAPPAEGADHA